MKDLKSSVNQKLAKAVEKVAVHSAKNVVGKSIHIGLHEVKVPDAVKKQFK